MNFSVHKISKFRFLQILTLSLTISLTVLKDLNKRDTVLSSSIVSVVRFLRILQRRYDCRFDIGFALLYTKFSSRKIDLDTRETARDIINNQVGAKILLTIEIGYR